MTKVYIVQMRGPEWGTIKKVFSNENDAKKCCKEMNSRKSVKDLFEALGTFQYIEMEVV